MSLQMAVVGGQDIKQCSGIVRDSGACRGPLTSAGFVEVDVHPLQLKVAVALHPEPRLSSLLPGKQFASFGRPAGSSAACS